MGLRAMLLRLRFGERFSYDTEKNMFFIKFEGHKVVTADDVKAIGAEVKRALSGLTVRPLHRELRQFHDSAPRRRRLFRHGDWPRLPLPLGKTSSFFGCLNLQESFTPDVSLIDIYMPAMGGHELDRLIREREQCSMTRLAAMRLRRNGERARK